MAAEDKEENDKMEGVDTSTTMNSGSGTSIVFAVGELAQLGEEKTRYTESKVRAWMKAQKERKKIGIPC